MAEDVDVAVRIDGFAAFRRDLRAIDRDLDKELRQGLKRGVERTVLPAARAQAPRRTGRLAASLRVSAVGNHVSITSRLPYANVQHWGGTTGPGHQFGRGRGSVYVRPTLFATRAVTKHETQIVDVLGDAVDDLARRHGFH